jgi:3-oxoacyl-[acyl-carrier protein] reductase
MDLGLAGRVCVVTGGSDGIGLATARRLRAEDAKVLLVGLDAERLAEAAEGLDGGEDELATLPLDLAEPDAGEQMLGAALEELGGIDVLVTIGDAAADGDWRGEFERLVVAPLQAMRAIAPALAERGWGRIVNVIPPGAHPSPLGVAASGRPDPGAAEAVAGAAELALSRLFADHHARDGVLVNAVRPAAFDAAAGSEAAAARDRTVAAEVVFLCSERASHVAGATWPVDAATRVIS